MRKILFYFRLQTAYVNHTLNSGASHEIRVHKHITANRSKIKNKQEQLTPIENFVHNLETQIRGKNNHLRIDSVMMVSTLMALYYFSHATRYFYLFVPNAQKHTQLWHIGVFPKWCRTFIEFGVSVNSGNLINRWSMNLAQFKDPVSRMCSGSILVSYTRGRRVEPF